MERLEPGPFPWPFQEPSSNPATKRYNIIVLFLFINFLVFFVVYHNIKW